MAEPFDTLMEVQEHDTTLDQLRHRVDTLPERAELAERGPKRRHALDRGARRCPGPGRRPVRPSAPIGGADRGRRPASTRDRTADADRGSLRLPRPAGHGPEVHQLARPPAAISRRRRWPCSRRRSRSTPCWSSTGRDPMPSPAEAGSARGRHRRGGESTSRWQSPPRKRGAPRAPLDCPTSWPSATRSCGPGWAGWERPGWWGTGATAAT